MMALKHLIHFLVHLIVSLMQHGIQIQIQFIIIQFNIELLKLYQIMI